MKNRTIALILSFFAVMLIVLAIYCIATGNPIVSYYLIIAGSIIGSFAVMQLAYYTK